MAEQSAPQILDDSTTIRAPRRAAEASRAARNTAAARQQERTGITFWQTIDKPMLIVVATLIAIGLMMVYSATFDWAFSIDGNPASKVMEQARNVGLSIIACLAVLVFGYRRMRRLSLFLLIGTVATLIAVLSFGDDVFNARRSLIGGSLQPGELAELATIIYIAAWLSSKTTRVRSMTYGLLPFAVLLGFISGLVILQPDISTAVIIIAVCGIMFFLAGADIVQIGVIGGIAGLVGVAIVMGGQFTYAESRVTGFIDSIADIRQADYHVRQAYVAFANGGWTGVGLGLSQQKFNALPSPHADSIFAIIGEEFGILGAGVVITLYALVLWRGLRIARNAGDSFGGLLAAGLTLWIIIKAMLNIAVMLALVPPTGIALPLISYGGSSMMTMLIGIGLILSVGRANITRELTAERRVQRAPTHSGRGNGRPRVSGAGGR